MKICSFCLISCLFVVAVIAGIVLYDLPNNTPDNTRNSEPEDGMYGAYENSAHGILFIMPADWLVGEEWGPDENGKGAITVHSPDYEFICPEIVFTCEVRSGAALEFSFSRYGREISSVDDIRESIRRRREAGMGPGYSLKEEGTVNIGGRIALKMSTSTLKKGIAQDLRIPHKGGELLVRTKLEEDASEELMQKINTIKRTITFQ